MNYIREINAFYDWLETNPLATSSIALWYALMHIGNKAGWPDKFAVAVSVLELKTGLKRDAIYDARNKLQQAGRINWESRKGNQSALYSLVPFVSDIPIQMPTQTPTQLPTQTPAQLPTINKLNNTKLINYDDYDSGGQNPFRTLDQEFGRLASPMEIETLNSFLDDGMEPDVVCEAIRRAREQGALNIKYVKTILNSWIANNVHDMAGVARVDLEFKQRNQQKASKDKPRKPGPDKQRKSKFDVLYTL